MGHRRSPDIANRRLVCVADDLPAARRRSRDQPDDVEGSQPRRSAPDEEGLSRRPCGVVGRQSQLSLDIRVTRAGFERGSGGGAWSGAGAAGNGVALDAHANLCFRLDGPCVQSSTGANSASPINIPPARSSVGPNEGSLLAMTLFEKYGQHQPLKRQSERNALEGVELSRSTLAGQVRAVPPCSRRPTSSPGTTCSSASACMATHAGAGPGQGRPQTAG
jgi:hypothetical protein